MSEIIGFFTANWSYILAALFAVSEVLAQIPAIKANSVFQLLTGFLKTLKK